MADKSMFQEEIFAKALHLSPVCLFARKLSMLSVAEINSDLKFQAYFFGEKYFCSLLFSQELMYML